MTCEFTWPLIDPNEEDRAAGRAHHCVMSGEHRSEHVCLCGDRVYVTKTGKVLTEADLDALADEAEQGYEVLPDAMEWSPYPVLPSLEEQRAEYLMDEAPDD